MTARDKYQRDQDRADLLAVLEEAGGGPLRVDLTEGKRIQALGFGAVAISYPRMTARILAAKREAGLV